jgi:Flp pilus assembly protein TadG
MTTLMTRLFRNMKRFRNIGIGSEGQEIAESAAVLPLLFMILLGIFWFGRAFNIYATITHGAREGARVAVAQSCATCGNVAPPVDKVGTAIQQVLQSSGLDPTQVTSTTPIFCPCGSTPCGSPQACSTPSSGLPQVCVQQDVQLNNPSTGQANVCGTVVSFQYPYQFYFPFTSLNMQKINLTTQVQMTGEN